MTNLKENLILIKEYIWNGQWKLVNMSTMLLKWYKVNMISQVTRWKGLWRGNLTLFVAFDWWFGEILIKILRYRKTPYPTPCPYPTPYPPLSNFGIRFSCTKYYSHRYFALPSFFIVMTDPNKSQCVSLKPSDQDYRPNGCYICNKLP